MNSLKSLIQSNLKKIEKKEKLSEDNAEKFPEVVKWLEAFGITKYKILDDGSVTPLQDINLGKFRFSKLKIKFNDTKYSFDFTGNLTNEVLESLEGCPPYVGGDFIINKATKLKSLKGGPTKVGKSFGCEFCESLTSLKYAPLEIGENFAAPGCSELKILDCPDTVVKGNFAIIECDNLIDLKGSPKFVGKDYNVVDCWKLKTLEGITPNIGEYSEYDHSGVSLDGCDELVSIKGLKRLNGMLYISSTKVTDLLNIFFIDDLKGFNSSSSKRLTSIINKHIKDDYNYAACQEELIESGLESYANLSEED